MACSFDTYLENENSFIILCLLTTHDRWDSSVKVKVPVSLNMGRMLKQWLCLTYHLDKRRGEKQIAPWLKEVYQDFGAESGVGHVLHRLWHDDQRELPPHCLQSLGGEVNVQPCV